MKRRRCQTSSGSAGSEEARIITWTKSGRIFTWEMRKNIRSYHEAVMGPWEEKEGLWYTGEQFLGLCECFAIQASEIDDIRSLDVVKNTTYKMVTYS